MELFEKHLAELSTQLTTEEQRERLKEAMKVYEGDDKLESSLDIEKRLREGEPIPVFSTGIVALDNLLRGGFRPGQLIVIGAQTKSGKTEFCVFLTEKMKERFPLWFSYEDGAEELVERFMDRNVTVPLFYTPSALKHRTVAWIEERVVESIVKYGTQLVFIDNLQSAVPRGNNQEQEYTFFVRGLKDVAEKWNIPIVLVHHVVKSDIERAPDLNDLKGSASIAQFANTVIMLWRQTARADNEIVITENVAVSVQAARRGKPGTVRMTFNGATYYENNWNSTMENFNSNAF